MSTRKRFLFLDTNVLSYLVQSLDFAAGRGLPAGITREELRTVLAELEARVERRELRVLLTMSLLQELAPIGAAGRMDLFTQALSLLLKLSEGRLIRDALERIPLEVKKGGRLSAAEILAPPEDVQSLIAALSSEAALSEIASDVRCQKEEYKEKERARLVQRGSPRCVRLRDIITGLQGDLSRRTQSQEELCLRA